MSHDDKHGEGATPRTDAAEKGWNPLDREFSYVRADFARRLERELAEANEARATLHQHCRDYEETIAALQEAATTARPSLAAPNDTANGIALEFDLEADRLEHENVYSAQGITRDWMRDCARRLRLSVLSPLAAYDPRPCTGIETVPSHTESPDDRVDDGLRGSHDLVPSAIAPTDAKDAARWRYFREEMDESDKLHMIASGTDHYDGTIDAAINASADDTAKNG